MTCSIFYPMRISLTFHFIERLLDENFHQTVRMFDDSDIISAKFSGNRRMMKYIG